MALKESKVGDVVEPDDAFSTTEVETEKFSFSWSIRNFPDLKHNAISQVFKGGPKGQFEWSLYIHPFEKKKGDSSAPQAQQEVGGNPEEEMYVGIFLNLQKSGEKTEVNAEWRLSLLDTSRKILATIHSPSNIFNKESSVWGWGNWISRSQILDPVHGLLSEGHKLRINCEIVTVLGVKNQPVAKKSGLLKDSGPGSDLESLGKKMMALFTLGKFSDVTLKTETESFPCSKFLLASHSPVFEAMFDSGMLESTENTVKIVDFPAHVVRGMLHFLYTGKTEMLEENSGELLSIADKYQIPKLKGKCVKTLMKNLNVENAAETLVSAHFHSPQILKPQVIQFINRMKKQVENTDGYKTMVKTHSIICADLYASLQ